MAAVAAAMSDPSRVKILCALMDGRAWTATELSIVADIAPSTASAHLAKLVDGKLLSCLSQGRHRYYRLADHDISELIEHMMGVSWKRIISPETRAPLRMRTARTCYDHLAGEVAVQIYDYMVNDGWISSDGAAITAMGKIRMEQLGAVFNSGTRRKPSCACLDWSERRFHLGGDAGAVLFIAFEHKRWINRIAGFREVSITPNGKMAFNRLFNIII